MPKNDKLLEDLLRAYYSARKHKRNTHNQLKFELRYESQLLDLHDQIINRTYQPLPEIAFIVNKPVKREIFAADFRDRVVHHLLFNYLNPILDSHLINDCYSCRVGKGTSYGVARVQQFMRGCSDNYTKDCYILKLDVKGYFMSIDKFRLYDIVRDLLLKEMRRQGSRGSKNNRSHKNNGFTQISSIDAVDENGSVAKIKTGSLNFDFDLVDFLLKVVIFNDPTKNCIIKGSKSDWHGLPKSKSLFYAKPNCGLPIGNLTSQLFGNVYLAGFDHFVKRELKVKYYGRYVDDFILFHQDGGRLKAFVPVIKAFFNDRRGLEVHPNKVYFQHYTKGLLFLGVIIKPYRTYAGPRLTGNFYALLTRYRLTQDFLPRLTSYLGFLCHHKTYKLCARYGLCVDKKRSPLRGFRFGSLGSTS